MTQTVINTLSNIEQMFSNKLEKQKVSETFNSSTDKIKDFKKILDSTLSENREGLTINDFKENILVRGDNNKIASLEFKKILQEVTEESNVETSLDLTLARDISEIISQLKEAVENANELIDVNSEEIIDKVSVENVDDELGEEVFENLLGVINLNQQEKNVDLTLEKLDLDVLKTVEELIIANSELNKNSELAKVSKILDTVQKEIVDIAENFETSDIIEIADNIADEVLTTKNSESVIETELDVLLDEELLKEINVESVSSETFSFEGNDLMQNQSPEEYVLKAMINQDVDGFDVKMESVQSSQVISKSQTYQVEANPSRILEQITKQFGSLQNNSKLNIVLNPESLGKVNIQLMNTKDGLTAQFVVTTQEARDILSKGLDGLKESLGVHGVAVDNVSIKLAEAQKSEYSQDWTEQEDSGGGNKEQRNSEREEKEKGLFERMMAQVIDNENGNV